jgi:Leucine-rich repeat (LRR) protein
MTSENLEVLKYCPDLLALDLGHQALTDISPIAEYLPDLRLLIIADNRVYDLSPLEKLKHLHYLEIFVNRVSDISPLAKLHELVDVNISYNAISDVTPLLNSPMMQRVWMESTYVGYNGQNVLKEKYPDAKIVLIGSGSVDQGWRWGNPRYEQMMDMWFHDYYGDEFQKYDDLAVELGLRDDE